MHAESWSRDPAACERPFGYSGVPRVLVRPVGLSDAMSWTDIARGRGLLQLGLARVAGRTAVAGIPWHVEPDTRSGPAERPRRQRHARFGDHPLARIQPTGGDACTLRGTESGRMVPVHGESA